MIMESLSKFARDGSGWVLDQVPRLDICIVKYQPLYASSYIPTPKEIAHPTKDIVNTKNDDSKCFLYCVIRSTKAGYIYSPHSKLLQSI